MVEPGQPAWRDIHRNFGPEVFDERGRLDREKLGAIVFRDEAKRRVLNAITHPRIQRAMLRRALWCFLRGERGGDLVSTPPPRTSGSTHCT